MNVGFGVGTVALAYGIANRLFGRGAARWSAFLVATAYPIVYYAHTTNLDIGYCFWLILALYCAIVASATDRPLAVDRARAPLPAMALATKEQGFAFLLPLPIMALGARVRRTGGLRAVWRAPTLWMVGSGAFTLLLANNALLNPLGFIGRIAYLLGHPLGTRRRASGAGRVRRCGRAPRSGSTSSSCGTAWTSSLGVPLLALGGARRR